MARKKERILNSVIKYVNDYVNTLSENQETLQSAIDTARPSLLSNSLDKGLNAKGSQPNPNVIDSPVIPEKG